MNCLIIDLGMYTYTSYTNLRRLWPRNGLFLILVVISISLFNVEEVHLESTIIIPSEPLSCRYISISGCVWTEPSTVTDLLPTCSGS